MHAMLSKQNKTRGDTHILKRNASLQVMLASKLEDIMNHIISIDEKKKIALDNIAKQITMLSNQRIKLLSKIQEKFTLSGDAGHIQRIFRGILLSKKISQLTPAELINYEKGERMLKNVKIIDNNISTLHKEIVKIKTKHTEAMDELYGKKRILVDLKLSIEELTEDIKELNSLMDIKERKFNSSICLLKKEEADIEVRKDLTSKEALVLLTGIKNKRELEKNQHQKVIKAYNAKILELHKLSIKKSNLKRQVYDAELENLKKKISAKTISPSKIPLVKEEMDLVKIEMYKADIFNLQREYLMVKTVKEKRLVDAKIREYKVSVSNNGGLKLYGVHYMFDNGGRMYYIDDAGRTIYKMDIESPQIYRLDDLENLVEIDKTKLQTKAEMDRKSQHESGRSPQRLKTTKAQYTAAEVAMYQKELGKELSIGLANVTLLRPNDPLSYFAHWLQLFSRNHDFGLLKTNETLPKLKEIAAAREAGRLIEETKKLNVYVMESKIPVLQLPCEAFNDLTEKQKWYTYHLAQANSIHKLVVSTKVSIESPILLILFYKIFTEETVMDFKKHALHAACTEDDVQDFLMYAAAVVSCCGNRQSFTLHKIIPGIPKDQFIKIVKTTTAYKKDKYTVRHLVNHCIEKIYLLPKCSSTSLQLYPNIFDGDTMYITDNVNHRDLARVKVYMKLNQTHLYNKRVIKIVKNNHSHFIIRAPSILKDFQEGVSIVQETNFQKNITFSSEMGDNSRLLKAISKHLKTALFYADNQGQICYLKNLMNYYLTGDYKYQLQSIKKVVQNKSVVEMFSGLMNYWHETHITLGEFGNIIVILNKKKQKQHEIMVNNINKYLALLPWSAEFENETFDSGCLYFMELFQCANTGTDVIMQFPYQHVIQKNIGHKEMIFTNLMHATHQLGDMKDIHSPLLFMDSNISKVYKEHLYEAYELYIDLMQVVGLGSGKLLMRNDDGTFNFNQKKLRNPLTCALIDKYYEPLETFTSRFGSIADVFNTVRAIGIALYLCLDEQLYEELRPTPNKKQIPFVVWLSLVYHGLGDRLHGYDIESEVWVKRKWLPEYIMARYLLEMGGDDLIRMEESCPIDDDEADTLIISLNEANIYTRGKEILRELILQLTIMKATGDVETATEFIDHWSNVPDKGRYPLHLWYMKYIFPTKTTYFYLPLASVPIIVKDDKQEEVEKTAVKQEEMKLKLQNDSVDLVIDTLMDETIKATLDAFQLNDLYEKRKKNLMFTVGSESDAPLPEVPLPVGEHIELKEYTPDAEGILQSFGDTFKDVNIYHLEETWAQLVPFFGLDVMKLNHNKEEKLQFQQE